MKQCESCGFQNVAAAKFCSQCAAPLPGAGAQWQEDEPPVVHDFRRQELSNQPLFLNQTPQVLPGWVQWLLRKEWIYWLILVVACAAILTWFLRNTNL